MTTDEIKLFQDILEELRSLNNKIDLLNTYVTEIQTFDLRVEDSR